jgi:hypothetical protein
LSDVVSALPDGATLGAPSRDAQPAASARHAAAATRAPVDFMPA